MSDLMPTCPRCGELGAPLARVCDECGHYLNDCDAVRDMQVRMAYARRYRYPHMDNPVGESLLDQAARMSVSSPVVHSATHREAPSARKEGRP